jgi:hypothetical protein
MRKDRKNKAPKTGPAAGGPGLRQGGGVENTLGSPESKRAYQFALNDFVVWYCSEPRLAFSKTAVLATGSNWRHGMNP